MSKASIDAIDRKILQHLIRNARMPFLEIARECGISGAAIHQRVKKLDEMGVILGSRLEVDPKASDSTYVRSSASASPTPRGTKIRWRR